MEFIKNLISRVYGAVFKAVYAARNWRAHIAPSPSGRLFLRAMVA